MVVYYSDSAMEVKKTHLNTYHGGIILMPLYIFVVIAHLFFAYKFQPRLNQGSNSISKTYTPYKEGVEFAFSTVMPKTTPSNSRKRQVLPVHHHVYLSLRVQRI